MAEPPKTTEKLIDQVRDLIGPMKLTISSLVLSAFAVGFNLAVLLMYNC